MVCPVDILGNMAHYYRISKRQSFLRERRRDRYWYAWGLGKFGSKSRGIYPGDKAKRGGWVYKS